MLSKQILLSLALLACLGLAMSAPVDEYDSEDDEDLGIDLDIEGETESNAALLPEESANTNRMVGTQALFIPFCQNALNLMSDKIQRETDEIKATLFNVIFKASQSVAAESLESGNQAIEQLTQHLREPNQQFNEVEDAANELAAEETKKDEVQNLIDATTKSIHERTNKSDLLASAITVVKVMAAKARAKIEENLTQLKNMVKPETIKIMKKGCEKFGEEYFDVVQKMFFGVRAKLTETAKSENESAMSEMVESMSLNKLNCGVTRRLINMRIVCNLYNAVGPVVLQMSQNNGSMF